MIKYYSTLNKQLYESEYAAQKAEDEYVENYFKEMDLKAAAKRRKMKHIVDSNIPKVTRINIR